MSEICFNYNFKDCTYSDTINPRRLRSLGGGLRRILSNIKREDKSLTNKKIIENLAYSAVSGDEKKLLSQISAVENNTKFNYQTKTKDINLNNLADNIILIYENIVGQKLTPNQKEEFKRRLENFAKNETRIKWSM